MGVLWVSAAFSFGAAVVVVMSTIAASYALVAHLHQRITQTLGRQISIESGEALRMQLRDWTRTRLRVLMILAAIAGALFAGAVGTVAYQLFGGR